MKKRLNGCTHLTAKPKTTKQATTLLHYYTIIKGFCYHNKKALESKEVQKMKNYKVDKDAIIAALESRNNRSAWTRGVNVYAIDLVENLNGLPSGTIDDINKALLNGADSWSQYSFGGNALIYDCDIAEALCTPSELKRKKGGELNPSSNEDWLDVQARALFQAANRVKHTIIDLNR